jgi:two-component system, response regulator PdtaR
MLNATLPPLRILVADDNFLIGMLLADMLASMGHNVCAVEMTETGTVSSAAKYRPDLLIVDGRLREGSGVTAVETILRTQPIPYVFVTGDPVYVRARMPDAVILEKPFVEATLEQAIRKAVRIDGSGMARGTGTISNAAA